MKQIIETKRLLLREWEEGSKPFLRLFLQDLEVMYAYEHSFSDEEIEHWLQWNLQSYKDNGYGLWAMERKDTGEIIGECGLTNQTIDGIEYKEIGYHLCKKAWKNGYAVEAAQAVKKFAFEQLQLEEVVSIIRDTNIASMNVAIRNQMIVKKRVIKHYQEKIMPHYIFYTKNSPP